MSTLGPTPTDDQDESSQSSIQVDWYGIKVSGAPAPGDDRPRSWREVASRLNKHLMCLAERLLGLPADVMVAASNFARGVGRIPDAASNRIAGAHVAADRIEEIRQIATVQSGGPQTCKPDLKASRNLEEVLLALQAKGVAVNVTRRVDGTVLIAAVQPELLERAQAEASAHPAPYQGSVFAELVLEKDPAFRWPISGFNYQDSIFTIDEDTSGLAVGDVVLVQYFDMTTGKGPLEAIRFKQKHHKCKVDAISRAGDTEWGIKFTTLEMH